jgi:hypothetical protein
MAAIFARDNDTAVRLIPLAKALARISHSPPGQ